MVVGFTRSSWQTRVCPGKPWYCSARTQTSGEAGPVARIVVDVMLREEIHDPQGEAIASAAHRLGFGQVLRVRQGKRFEVELSGPADEASPRWPGWPSWPANSWPTR